MVRACVKDTNYLPTTGFLAFDIVHAVEFSRIGCSWFSPFLTATQGRTCRSLCLSLSLEATCLTYHFDSACQIGDCDSVEARHIDFSYFIGWVFHPMLCDTQLQ